MTSCRLQGQKLATLWTCVSSQGLPHHSLVEHLGVYNGLYSEICLVQTYTNGLCSAPFKALRQIHLVFVDRNTRHKQYWMSLLVDYNN